MFESAAKGYEGYLERFPRSKQAYEVQFFAAECQYNSLQFAKAAKNYDAIRDNGADDRYRKDAAYGAVLAWSKLIEQLQERRSSPGTRCSAARTGPRARSRRASPFARGEVAHRRHRRLPPAVAEGRARPRRCLQGRRAALRPQPVPRRAPALRGRSSSYPRSEVAKYATNLTVETFLIDKDWRSVEEVSARLAQNTDVIDPKSELYKDLVKFKLAGRFKLADELMAQGDWDEAAKKYIAAGGRGPEERVRRQGAEQRRGLLREGPPVRERAQALRAHLPRVPEQQAGRRRAVPGRGEPGELATTSTRRCRATSGW